MSYVEQFEKAVTEAGAVAIRIMRGSRGAERLIIQTPGGLITREVPLRGDLGKDIQLATTSAKEIVASAKDLIPAAISSDSPEGFPNRRNSDSV
jgi:hypothetical protein